MANFSLYINSKFKPFSYQEMLAPALMATQAHQELEDSYGDLNSQADAIGSLINETNDPVTAARYKAFENDLRNKADELAKNGLTPGSRKSLLDMKSRYYHDITPIKNAIERRRTLADEQRKMIAQNPTLMYQRDLRSYSPESSLDRFLENPEYDYGESYSGALITQQVSQMASHLATELRGVKSGRLDAFTKTFLKNYGLTSDEVMLAINNPKDPRASKALAAIYNSAIGTVPQTIKDKYSNEIRKYANQGFWSAVGQSQVSTYEDYGARLAAQEASQKRVAAYQNSIKNPTGGYPLNPTPIISDMTRKNINKLFKKYSKYFYTDRRGQYRMNQAGLKEYLRTIKGEVAGKVVTTPEGTTIRVASTNKTAKPTEFRELIDSLGGAKYIFKNKSGLYTMQSGNLGNLWGKYGESANLGKGMQRTEYVEDITKEDQYNYKNAVLRAARADGKLYGADMDDKTDKFIRTGDNLPLSDLESDNYSIISRGNSSYDRTLFIINKKTGEVKRYFSPSGIHYNAEKDSDKALRNMRRIEDALMSGKINGAPMTPSQREALTDEYIYYSNQYGMINSQVGTTYGTPTEKPNPTTW